MELSALLGCKAIEAYFPKLGSLRVENIIEESQLNKHAAVETI